MYSKDFGRRRESDLSFKINSNVIFETKQYHNFQFDLHPQGDLDYVLCSTFIKDEYIKEGRSSTVYLLALIKDRMEVGSLEISISKEKAAKNNNINTEKEKKINKK